MNTFNGLKHMKKGIGVGVLTPKTPLATSLDKFNRLVNLFKIRVHKWQNNCTKMEEKWLG